MSGPIFTEAQRDQVCQDLIVLTQSLPGPFRVEVWPLDPEGEAGFSLKPVSPGVPDFHELAHLQLGWWAQPADAQAAAVRLQAWFDRRALDPWQPPAEQTLHAHTLSIDVRDPLAGYQRRIWSEQAAPGPAVSYWAQIHDTGPCRTLGAVSLRSPAAASAMIARVVPGDDGVDLLGPEDQETFAPLLERWPQGHHGQWGQAEVRVNGGGQIQTLTCAAAAYLSPCLDFGLVTAFGPGGPLAFAVPFCSFENGAGEAGVWQQALSADLLAFRPAALVVMNAVTFGG